MDIREDILRALLSLLNEPPLITALETDDVEGVEGWMLHVYFRPLTRSQVPWSLYWAGDKAWNLALHAPNEQVFDTPPLEDPEMSNKIRAFIIDNKKRCRRRKK